MQSRCLYVFLDLQSKPKKRILKVTLAVTSRIHKPKGSSKRVRLDNAVKLFLKEHEERV